MAECCSGARFAGKRATVARTRRRARAPFSIGAAPSAAFSAAIQSAPACEPFALASSLGSIHIALELQPSSETSKCDLRARLRPDRRCLSIVGATRHRPVLGQPLVCRTATVVSLYRSRTRQFTTSVRAILDCIWTVHDVDNPSAPTRSSAFRHRVEGSLPRKATSPNLNSKRKPEQSGPEQQRSRFLCQKEQGFFLAKGICQLSMREFRHKLVSQLSSYSASQLQYGLGA